MSAGGGLPNEPWKVHVCPESPGTMGWMLRYRHMDTWFDFAAYEVVALRQEKDGSEVPEFYVEGWVSSHELTGNLDEAEITIGGYVKWDGCTEMDLSRAHHHCGRRDLKAMTDMMLFIHDFARVALGRQEESMFE